MVGIEMERGQEMSIINKFKNWHMNNASKCRQIKNMVIVQFLFSVILYIVLIANQLTNHYDALWSGNYALSGRWELSIGRWFWLYIDCLRMGISSEPLTSCLALFLIIIGNMLLLDIFGQIGRKTGYLAGIIILSSTTVCSYLSYRYMSPTFGASFFLSILAAWILAKKPLKAWLSVLAVVLQLGSYQANIACTCVILVIVFMKMLIENEANKRVIHFVIESFFSLAAGCIIYKLIWEFHLHVLNISPSSYKGADSVSVGSIVMCFPHNIIKTYKVFIDYFFGKNIKHNIFQNMGLYYLVYGIVIITLVMKIVALFNKSKIKVLLITAACAVLPMACNASLFIATEAGGVAIQMTAGMAILFPVILCFACSIKETGKELHKKNYKIIKIFYMVISVIILYGNVYMTAIDQETMYEGRNSTETLVRGVVSELGEKQMLSADRSYVFIGYPSGNPLFGSTKFRDMANPYARYGEFWAYPDLLRMAYNGVLRDIGINLTYAEDDVSAAMNGRDDVKNMPLFPAEGSIQEIDGYIVIKVSNV